MHEHRADRINWLRVAIATVVANLTTLLALGVLFGNPIVEPILYTDQAGQSAKVLSVFFEHEPLPVVTPFWDDVLMINSRKLVVQGLLLLWSLSLVMVFATVWQTRPVPPWRKGLEFGLATWATLFIFFEAFVPHNLLGEPIRLVALELTLQLVAMILTGLVIALLYKPVSIGAGSERISN